MKKVIFIAWNSYHTRNKSISNIIGIKSFHIGKKYNNQFKTLLSYINKICETYSIIQRETPKVIIVTNTIFLLPLVCLIIGKFKNIKIILDTHSCGIENSFWAYSLFLRKYFVKKAAFSLVTNEEHKRIVESWQGKVIILPDPPLKLMYPANSFYQISKKFNLVFINNYLEDEPYDEVISAVKNLPEIHLYITGNPKTKKVNNTENITHTGYLPISEYLYLISNADALIVLTTREDTFQCGGNEALSLKQPLIISDTKFLRNYFGDAALFVKSESRSIESGILKVYRNKNEYKNKISDLLLIKVKEINSILNLVKSEIERIK